MTESACTPSLLTMPRTPPGEKDSWPDRQPDASAVFGDTGLETLVRSPSLLPTPSAVTAVPPSPSVLSAPFTADDVRLRDELEASMQKCAETEAVNKELKQFADNFQKQRDDGMEAIKKLKSECSAFNEECVERAEELETSRARCIAEQDALNDATSRWKTCENEMEQRAVTYADEVSGLTAQASGLIQANVLLAKSLEVHWDKNMPTSELAFDLAQTQTSLHHCEAEMESNVSALMLAKTTKALAHCEAALSSVHNEHREASSEMMVYMRKADPLAAYTREIRVLIQEGFVLARDEASLLKHEQMELETSRLQEHSSAVDRLSESAEAAEAAADEDPSHIKKAAHNQYMRYWRAVQKPSKIGTDLYEKIKSGKVSSLFDLFIEAKENWSVVHLMHKKYEETKHTGIKQEFYKTRGQLLDMYKSEKVVDAIISDRRHDADASTASKLIYGRQVNMIFGRLGGPLNYLMHNSDQQSWPADSSSNHLPGQPFFN